MKFYLHECYIAWFPSTDHVELVSKEIDSTILQGYHYYYWGISETEYGKLTDAGILELILALALNLIITYRCDPQAVHEVFLQLKEYADGWADLFTYIKSSSNRG